MFAAERKKIIKRYLIENSKVSVAKLSELLEVSEVTIRRDLETLEKTGFLQRTHGGAILVEEDYTPPPTLEDTKVLQEQKEIADTAFNLVADYDTVLLTDGATNIQIAKRLTAKVGLTVLTNDLLIALEFGSSPLNRVIIMGGNVTDNVVYGQLCHDNLRNFSIKHVFMDVEGISISNGLSVNTIDKASFIQIACSSASCVTAVCLADRFDRDALYRIGPVSFPKRIITSSNLIESYKKELFDMNIQLYTSIDLYEG